MHYRVVTPPPQQERPEVPLEAEQSEKAPTKEQVPSTHPLDQVSSRPQPVEAVPSDKFSFDLSVDPGDPINRPKVPLLKPMHDGSNLVGFTVGNPDYATEWADTPVKNPEKPAG